MGNFPVVPVKEFCLKHGISEFSVYCRIADEVIDAFVVGGRVWIGRRDAMGVKNETYVMKLNMEAEERVKAEQVESA